MPMLADTADAVIGVDTHTGTHTACLVDRLGRQLAVITIPADPGGCRRLLAWARQHAPGPQLAWSIEGTRSHGLGLTRYLQAHGQLVTEAGRPERASKRPGGKPDPADAARAARDALAAGRLAQPRSDGNREALRILLAARAQATTARTAAVNMLKALILGSPDDLRGQLRGLSTPRQASRCRSLRVHASQPIAEQVLRAELRRLATHIGAWDKELRANKDQLRQLAAQVMPVLLEQPGVGPMSAAQLLVSWSPPRKVPVRGNIRRPGRGQPAAGIIRQDHPAPAQPLRRPRAQPRPARHRQLAHAPPCGDQGLPGPAPRRAENRSRDPPLPQALRSPATVPHHGDSLRHLTTHRSVKRSLTSPSIGVDRCL